MTRKRIFSSVAVIVLVAMVFFIVSTLSAPKVKNNQLSDYEYILIDGVPHTAAELASGLRLNTGTHTLKAGGRFNKPVQVTFKSKSFKTTELHVDAKRFSEQELFAYMGGAGIESNQKVFGGKLFENESWMTTTVGSEDGSSEGYVNIYHYVDGNWKVIDSGTGFDIDTTRDSGIPDSIIKFLTGEE